MVPPFGAEADRPELCLRLRSEMEQLTPLQEQLSRFLARADLSEAVRTGDLDESADSEEAFRLLTTLGAGIASQQFANQPGATYETGIFTSLTDRALDMFVQQYAPRRSRGTSPTSPKRDR